MTPSALAERLVERGLDAGELAAKRSLFDLVVGTFGDLETRPRRSSATFQSSPHVWWIPGRLEVFGKHTDYAGGRTLVCAAPKGLAVAAGARPDDVVHVVDARRSESVTLHPSADSTSLSGWRHYAEVVVQRLGRNFPGTAMGADVVFASDLPPASGMSSSSALIVGLAAALVRVTGIDARVLWQTNIRTPLDAAGYYACIENGLTFGTLAGDAGVGTHGGSEDHAAILSGTPGHLSAFRFVPMRQLDSVRLPDEWRFVLAPCGVASEKTGAAKDAYNRLARGAQVLLEIWNGAEPKAGSLGFALQSRASAADRLRDLVRRSSIAGWSADALVRRLDHFIREDARVPDALDAFREADAARLSTLSAQSQADAERLLGNQISETMTLSTSARGLGAFAACSFGAGFGGSVWALVDRGAAAEFARRWHQGAFIADPAPSLTEL